MRSIRMVLPFQAELEILLRPKLGSEFCILDFQPVPGGCISNGGRLETSAGAFFLKYHPQQPLDFFAAEAHGLLLLAECSSLSVPRPVYYSMVGACPFFLMQWIDRGPRMPNYWNMLGEQLAQQHRQTHILYGLGDNNYIGALRQYNSRHNKWSDFFREERIAKQLDLAEQRGRMPAGFRQQFDSLYARLDDIFPAERPALLHGDLWSGNVIVGRQGQPVVIDPAVYYGHREMDVAFTTLFGGFDAGFYEAYQATYPLEPGFDERKDIYNLYPLLVHWNLFGENYRLQTERILKRFISKK